MKKGQITMSAILDFVIVIILFVVIYPALHEILITHQTDNAVLNTLINFIPIVIILSLIFGFIWYVFPKKEVIQR